MLALIVLDGWGLSPNWQGNAISLAKPQYMAELWRLYPHAVLQPYQSSAGRTHDKIGSSDVGHAILGAGRLLRSDLEEILETIHQGTFAHNPILSGALKQAAKTSSRLHLISLVSDGEVHGDPKILIELLKLAHGYQVPHVFIHAVTDGRDVLPASALSYLETLQDEIKHFPESKIGSLIGRYYAMDRDQHWDRTQRAYNLWTNGIGQPATSATEAIHSGYRQGATDETLPPFILDPTSAIRDNDTVIICMTRADRLQQLVRAFSDPNVFRPLVRRQAPLRKLRALTTLVSPRIQSELNDVAFPPANIRSTLAEILAGRGLTQLRASESEKTAHVTYMFDGGRIEPFQHEDELFVPSPKQATSPGSATPILVDKILGRLHKKAYDFALVNLANVDLVAHGGDLLATSQAVAIADQALKKLVDFILAREGTVLITADHGAAEQMLGLSGPSGHRAHTPNPVPFILAARDRQKNLIQQATSVDADSLATVMSSRATLADVAPTILELFGIPIPVEMTGVSLLDRLH